MLYADGKVLSPVFRAQPGDTRLDKTTGELRPLRAGPDAGLHFEGTGETAWGTKWVLVAVRSNDVYGRVIVDVDSVPTPGGEAAAWEGASGSEIDVRRATHHHNRRRHRSHDRSVRV